MAKNCVICGKPSGMYPLCKEHLEMKNNGQVEKCADCDTWYVVKDGCKCKIKQVKPLSDLTCIICDEPSNNKHFCLKCYNKYKNKVAYLEVKNCKEFKLLDYGYESDLTCDDVHLVKSPYEKLIDNWLYSENIKHAYEKKIYIDETTFITPDFYISEYKGIKDIYVEFWGYGEENKKYQNIKEYKMKLYPDLVKNQNIAVVYLNKKEVDDDSYRNKIQFAKQGTIKE